MKAWNAITCRLKNPRSRSLRASVLVLTGAAMLSALAAQTHHRAPVAVAPLDPTPVEPLPGRDYSMRLDTARSRMQFLAADARIAGITPLSLRDDALAHLEPGLWLAVPQPRSDGGTDLVLQPMGATAPRRFDGVVIGDDAGFSSAVRAHILERGGGVVFVDAGAAQNARADRSPVLASQVP